MVIFILNLCHLTLKILIIKPRKEKKGKGREGKERKGRKKRRKKTRHISKRSFVSIS